jgi:dolichol-phosphate mannosyltransferase
MLDILLRLHSIGAKIEEVPLVLRYDLKESPSKLRVLRTVKNTLRLLAPRRD